MAVGEANHCSATVARCYSTCASAAALWSAPTHGATVSGQPSRLPPWCRRLDPPGPQTQWGAPAGQAAEDSCLQAGSSTAAWERVYMASIVQSINSWAATSQRYTCTKSSRHQGSSSRGAPALGRGAAARRPRSVPGSGPRPAPTARWWWAAPRSVWGMGWARKRNGAVVAREAATSCHTAHIVWSLSLQTCRQPPTQHNSPARPPSPSRAARAGAAGASRPQSHRWPG